MTYTPTTENTALRVLHGMLKELNDLWDEEEARTKYRATPAWRADIRTRIAVLTEAIHLIEEQQTTQGAK